MVYYVSLYPRWPSVPRFQDFILFTSYYILKRLHEFACASGTQGGTALYIVGGNGLSIGSTIS